MTPVFRGETVGFGGLLVFGLCQGVKKFLGIRKRNRSVNRFIKKPSTRSSGETHPSRQPSNIGLCMEKNNILIMENASVSDNVMLKCNWNVKTMKFLEIVWCVFWSLFFCAPKDALAFSDLQGRLQSHAAWRREAHGHSL